jgi:FeS assembly SUF system protein
MGETNKTGYLHNFLNPGTRAEEENMDKATTEMVEGRPSQGKIPDEQRDRDLEIEVADKLREIFDPEIPVNIYELGLVYGIRADREGNVEIVMTLTTPHCPVAESMPSEVEMKARDVAGVRDVKVELVWDPPWDMTMMSEAARLELGFL